MTGAHRTSETPCSVRAHELLADPLRRQLIFELAQRDEPVCVDTLAEALTERPTGAGPGPVQVPEAKSTAVELHHCHLPKLDEAGWIEYDDDSQAVRWVATDKTLHEGLQGAIRELERIQAVFEDCTK